MVPPDNWQCFPKVGGSTVVWVRKDQVDQKLTKALADKKTQRWWTEDKIAVAVARLGDVDYLILSAHCDSRGQTSREVLHLAKSLHQEMSCLTSDLEMIVGMDSNVKTGNTGSAASPESLED